MEIDHEEWDNANEWLSTLEIAALTKTSRSFWDKMRGRGGGPEWTDFGNRPRYNRAKVEVWIISRTIRNTSQRGRS